MDNSRDTQRSNLKSNSLLELDQRFKELMAQITSTGRSSKKSYFHDSPNELRLRRSVVNRAVLKSTITTSTPMPVSRKLMFTPEGQTVSPVNSGITSNQKKNSDSNFLKLNKSHKENEMTLKENSVINLSSLSEPTCSDERFRNKNNNLEKLVTKLSQMNNNSKTLHKSDKRRVSESRKLARNFLTYNREERQTQTGESLKKTEHLVSTLSRSSSSDMSDFLRECERCNTLGQNKIVQVTSTSNLPVSQKSLNFAAPWRAPSGLKDDYPQPNLYETEMTEESALDDIFLPKQPPPKKVFANKREGMSTTKKQSRKKNVTNDKISRDAVDAVSLNKSRSTRATTSKTKMTISITNENGKANRSTDQTHSFESLEESAPNTRSSAKKTKFLNTSPIRIEHAGEKLDISPKIILHKMSDESVAKHLSFNYVDNSNKKKHVEVNEEEAVLLEDSPKKVDKERSKRKLKVQTVEQKQRKSRRRRKEDIPSQTPFEGEVSLQNLSEKSSSRAIGKRSTRKLNTQTVEELHEKTKSKGPKEKDAVSPTRTEESSCNLTLRRSTRNRRPPPPKNLGGIFTCTSVSSYRFVTKWQTNTSKQSNIFKKSLSTRKTGLSKNVDTRYTMSPIPEAAERDANENEYPQPGTSSSCLEKRSTKLVKSGRINKKEKKKNQVKKKVNDFINKTMTSVNSNDQDENTNLNSLNGVEDICDIVQPYSINLSSRKQVQDITLTDGIGMIVLVNNPRKGYSSGLLKIAPGTCKPKQIANKHNMIFWVLEGRCLVNINNKNNTYSVHSAFSVLKGSEYCITNLNKKDHLLLSCTRWLS